MAYDRFGRRLHYLRISVTDHCNLRCVYCMPEDAKFMPNSALMTRAEILHLARLFAAVGFDKIRLTGGEPTVRPDIMEIVRGLRSIPGIREITMTTNGILLSRLAKPLAEAGLDRVNISLDTLNPAKFRRITRRGDIEDVIDGIYAAEEAGLEPVKINAVVVRGYNEADVVDLARLTLEHPWQVRFIEMMPFAGATDFQRLMMVTAEQMKERIEAALGKLEPVDGGALRGEARMYRIPGAVGEIGFIASVSKPFCAACTRARLTADGRLRLCLLREDEVDLLTPLRNGADDEEMRRIIVSALWRKPWGHGLAQGEAPQDRSMNQIGG